VAGEAGVNVSVLPQCPSYPPENGLQDLRCKFIPNDFVEGEKMTILDIDFDTFGEIIPPQKETYWRFSPISPFLGGIEHSGVRV